MKTTLKYLTCLLLSTKLIIGKVADHTEIGYPDAVKWICKQSEWPGGLMQIEFNNLPLV